MKTLSYDKNDLIPCKDIAFRRNENRRIDQISIDLSTDDFYEGLYLTIDRGQSSWFASKNGTDLAEDLESVIMDRIIKSISIDYINPQTRHKTVRLTFTSGEPYEFYIVRPKNSDEQSRIKVCREKKIVVWNIRDEILE